MAIFMMLGMVGGAGFILKFVLGLPYGKDKDGKPQVAYIRRLPATMQPFVGSILANVVYIGYSVLSGSLHGQDVLTSIMTVLNDPTATLAATAIGGVSSQAHNAISAYLKPPDPVIVAPANQPK